MLRNAFAAPLIPLTMMMSSPAFAEEDTKGIDEQFTGHVVSPAKGELGEGDLGRLSLPDGFELGIFAKDLVNPRMMAIAEDGTVYVTRRSVGDVVMLRDTDGDGAADEQKVVANRPQMHGIAISGRDMYLATVTDVYHTTINEDSTLAELTRIIDDLPDGGQHPNRTLAVGPDSMLYISVGSTCNACAESNPEAATLLRATPDGKKRTILAAGLRNTIGFDWHPATGQLFGMDHNADWFGDDQPGEELNLIEDGKTYGWPYVFADGFINPQMSPPGELTGEAWDAASERPLLQYTAHAAPMQMAFHHGAGVPEEYRHDAFVAMRGSWNRKPPSGYEVVRIVFEDDRPTAIEPFLTGFLSEEGGAFTRYARPAGLAIAPDGALFLSDDENGVIYRIAYTGDAPQAEAAPETAAAETGPSVEQAAQGEAAGLAAEVVASGREPSLEVKSTAFDDQGEIPLRFTDYGHKISPDLAWSAGPDGTRSYAIVMDDPDAAPRLVNHWGIFNIPADVTALPQGLPTDPSLALPKGAAQTVNTLGRTGYFGPRPPAGDEPHRYHFQVFALDTELELPPGSDREALLEAMQGHVVAHGRLVGSFQRKPETEQLVEAARDLRRKQDGRR